MGCGPGVPTEAHSDHVLVLQCKYNTHPAALLDKQVWAAQIGVHVAALMDVHHPTCNIMQHLHAALPGQVLQVLHREAHTMAVLTPGAYRHCACVPDCNSIS